MRTLLPATRVVDPFRYRFGNQLEHDILLGEPSEPSMDVGGSRSKLPSHSTHTNPEEDLQENYDRPVPEDVDEIQIVFRDRVLVPGSSQRVGAEPSSSIQEGSSLLANEPSIIVDETERRPRLTDEPGMSLDASEPDTPPLPTPAQRASVSPGDFSYNAGEGMWAVSAAGQSVAPAPSALSAENQQRLRTISKTQHASTAPTASLTSLTTQPSSSTPLQAIAPRAYGRNIAAYQASRHTISTSVPEALPNAQISHYPASEAYSSNWDETELAPQSSLSFSLM